MRFQVKPHSGILLFFSSPRGPSALTIGHLAGASLLPLPWHSFSPAALPSPGRGGEQRGRKNARLGDVSTRGPLLAKPIASAGALHGPSSSPEQPSIRVTPATAPLPLTLYARSVLDAQSRVYPSNERCPRGSPGGLTATLSDWLSPLRIAAVTLLSFLRLRFRLGSDNSHRYTGCLLRVTASRGTHVQMPIFLGGSLGQLTLVRKTPQRD
jgi:hypothetical protein